MKKILALTLLLCLMLSLCACGKKEESAPAANNQAAASGEPQASINPTFMDWGSRREVVNSADPWYPNGQIGEEFIYFARGESSSGIVFYREKAGQLVAEVPCSLSEDLHLANEGDAEKFDLIFPTEFHAYDVNTKTWYIRANPDFMMSLFVDKSFTEKSDSGNTIIFNADGSATEVYQGTEYKGTWKIVNATTIRFTVSEEEYYEFDLVINGDNTLNSLSEYNNRSFVTG